MRINKRTRDVMGVRAASVLSLSTSERVRARGRRTLPPTDVVTRTISSRRHGDAESVGIPRSTRVLFLDLGDAVAAS